MKNCREKLLFIPSILLANKNMLTLAPLGMDGGQKSLKNESAVKVFNFYFLPMIMMHRDCILLIHNLSAAG